MLLIRIERLENEEGREGEGMGRNRKRGGREKVWEGKGREKIAGFKVVGGRSLEER